MTEERKAKSVEEALKIANEHGGCLLVDEDGKERAYISIPTPEYNHGCGGPSQEHAYRQADEATAEFLKMIAEKYNVVEPFPGRVIPQGYPAGFGLKSQDEWEELVEKLEETVKDLFWTSHAAGF